MSLCGEFRIENLLKLTGIGLVGNGSTEFVVGGVNSHGGR